MTEISGDNILTRRVATGGRICLASGSPRRRAMLSGAGLEFDAISVDLDETPHVGEDPLEYTMRMARSKAERGMALNPAASVTIGSDTVVTFDGHILGKPQDEDDAAQILSALSGRAHTVISGWALWGKDGLIAEGKGISKVHFNELSAESISEYIQTGEPLDKAGAYGIQGLGGRLVSAFEGTFDTIVGLPVGQVLAGLHNCGALPGPTSDLAVRLAVLRARVAAACDAAGREPGEVRLVGASKAQPIGYLEDAVEAGLEDLGESYVQEWLEKESALEAEVRWHFIGRLQRNKVKFVAPRAHMIHGVDSPRLAEAIGRSAVGLGRSIPVLIQVNLGSEASKSGVSMEELPGMLDVARGVEGIELKGLMALPPHTGLSDARRWFALLRELRDTHRNSPLELPELSMGMSGDFDAAIVEGATMIRLGTALFGARKPRN